MSSPIIYDCNLCGCDLLERKHFYECVRLKHDRVSCAQCAFKCSLQFSAKVRKQLPAEWRDSLGVTRLDTEIRDGYLADDDDDDKPTSKCIGRLVAMQLILVETGQSILPSSAIVQ